jgi:hypothetical protein
MRIALIVLIAIHGIIHLFGFLKAFGLSEFNAITQPVSKPFGILWLLAFILLITAAFLLMMDSHYYWVLAGIAILLSQLLIISFWTDARFGTIINLMILVSVLLAYSFSHFIKKVNAERKQMLTEMTASKGAIISEQMFDGLPAPVVSWLLASGISGKVPVQSISLEQSLEMLAKPEQKEWYKAHATQYFTIDPPAFNWTLQTKINPFMPMVGRDKFEHGKGEMEIKLLSFIPVAHVKNNSKTNEATLQRYLAELVWFPSAALNPYIRWEAIDDHSAKATMRIAGTEGSGVFYFDEKGFFQKFVALRYKESDKNAIRIPWTVTALKTEEKNGIFIPTELKVDWTIDHREWTWLKLKIEQIEYYPTS